MEKYVDFLEKYLYDVTVLKGLNINENLTQALNSETNDNTFDAINESVEVINEASVQIMSTRASTLGAALEDFSSSDEYDDDYDEPVQTKAIAVKKQKPSTPKNKF